MDTYGHNHGGQCLRAKEKGGQERTRRHLRDARPADDIKTGKDQIDAEIDREQEQNESGPVQCQDPVIDIPPLLPAGIDFEKLHLSNAHRNRSWVSFHE